MYIKLFLVVGLVGFLQLLSTIGLLPVIPSTTESAVVKFECESGEKCSEYYGTLHKSWTGTYSMHLNEEAYLWMNTEELVSVDDNVFTFKDGFVRQYPVMVVDGVVSEHKPVKEL
jgi:hypothetical protein